ncbi:multidrug transporter [Sphingomonas sp. ABOLF]|uniref:DMT family transporter n=1 Tax=Sphingomonas sp. ABOLF TaxID=1985879 RepID=UPI000F7E8BC4|nr:SMR family transporter [Sphingomonas sp. ABOLF]RSV12306.1 multidrug transporter [Sphingomonas sp. ABOLF]
MKWLLVVAGILANASASVLVKVASNGRIDMSSPVRVALNPYLITAVLSYGLAFLLYSAALSRLPLNVAHPVMTAGAIVVVGLCSLLFFREPASLGVILGYALLLAGIVVLAFFAQA